MRLPKVQRRTLALIVVVAPLLALFVYVALRSGPLAPVPITVTKVQARSLSPALFGIGTVQARYVYKIGPTYAGRVKRVDVQVGEMVKAGQSLGEIDPVDLNERIVAGEAAIKSGEAARRQAQAKQLFAKTQANRYERLLAAHSVSEEMVATKRQELAVANAALSAAREDLNRLRADVQALRAQRTNLSLLAPVSGLVVARDADPGTTVVAGQAVVELIDPANLWIDTRFDQISAEGLAAGLPAEIVLRSRHGRTLKGRVLRVEPLADQVTEETLAKIVFGAVPKSLPPIGELAEVTLQLPQLPAAPTIPNAAIREVNGQRGVWKVEDGGLAFTPIVLGRSDLQGNVQVREGLSVGDRIVVYSARALRSSSRIRVVAGISGVSP